MTEKNAERFYVIKNETESETIAGNEYKILREKDFNYLIEQAERAQKLESICESLKTEWRGGVLEIKRLREALEFYADGNNFKTFDSPAIKDYGEKARQALEGVSNDQTIQT